MESSTVRDNRCRSPSIYREDDPIIVDTDICEHIPKQLRKEENNLLNNVSANRGMIHKITWWYSEQSTMPLSYLIGIPFGWLLLGTFQYFVCVILLGDRLLDPWYFTCVWIVEIICMFHITVIITIVKCSFVSMEILEYCEKITWTGFTYLLFQGLAIILLLIPISNFFKHVIGDFSRPINFFIYWMIIAFPHLMILCFASFGCCSKALETKGVHNFECMLIKMITVLRVLYVQEFNKILRCLDHFHDICVTIIAGIDTIGIIFVYTFRQQTNK